MSLHAKLSQRVPVDAVAVESKHPHTCPNCGVLNEFTSGQVKQYRPGDVSICAECQEFGIFMEGGGMRKPTEQEYRQLANHPYALELRGLMVAAKKGELS